MSKQGWDDWEEYNRGLQGTQTGSPFNDMGLADRPNNNKPSTAAHRQRKQSSSTTGKSNDKNENSPAAQKWNKFQFLIFFVVFLGICYWLNLEGYKDPWIFGLSGLIGGILVAQLYKVILGLIGLIIVLAIASHFIYT